MKDKFIIKEALKDDVEFREKWNSLPPEIQKYYLEVQEGKRTITFYNDVVFKKLLDPDTKKQRLSSLLSLIIGKKVRVLHSLRNEGTLLSVYAKKKILDITAQIESGELVDIEMQVMAEEYVGERAAIYSCDLMNRQYSVDVNENKKEYSYGDLKKVYCITLLKQSPNEFLVTDKYIHKSKQQMDTEVELNMLQEYFFIELDKYIMQNAGKIPNTLLGAWIVFIGSDSIKTKLDIIEKYPEFGEIQDEIVEMSFDRKELLTMTDHNLELMERNRPYVTGLNKGRLIGKEEGRQEGRREGRQEGRQEGLQEGRQEERKKMAISLMDVLDIETISIKTGLSVKEIEMLKMGN